MKHGLPGEERLGLENKICKAMIPATLDIQGSQVKSSRPRRAKQEVAHGIDHSVINFLSCLCGEAAQDRVDSIVDDLGGIEERIRKCDMPF